MEVATPCGEKSFESSEKSLKLRNACTIDEMAETKLFWRKKRLVWRNEFALKTQKSGKLKQLNDSKKSIEWSL